MTFFEIILIAFGLAMDAFAVSVASGVILRGCCVRNALKIAFSFGFFQAIMPVIGWMAGLHLNRYIQKADHWIAFGLLVFIGIKMIVESRQFKSDKRNYNPLDIGTLFLLSVATSIDALAVGLSLGILLLRLWLPIIVIGLVTFGMSFTGVYLGDRTGHLFEKYAECIGGMVLIGIGIKILVDHIG